MPNPITPGQAAMWQEFFAALEAHDADKVASLLDAGWEADGPGDGGATPLQWAASAGSLDICRLLLARGANPNAENGAGGRSLSGAATASVALCQLLAAHGAQLDFVDETGFTLLHHAAASGKEDVCAYLLGQGLALEARTGADATPLHLAAAGNHVAACRYLVGQGARPSFVPDNALGYYLTPFQEAVRMSAMDAVSYFVFECGESLDQRTLNGQTLAELGAFSKTTPELLHALRTELAVRAALMKDPETVHEVSAALGKAVGGEITASPKRRDLVL